MVPADDHVDCLVEALRRWLCFSVRRDNKKPRDMTTAWTGLGSRNHGYGRMERFGLMRIAPGTSDNAPHDSWWSLTDKGAAIVRRWMSEGFGVGDGYAVVHKSDLDRRPMIDRADLRSTAQA